MGHIRLQTFHGDIRVQSDAALVVTETIRVFAKGTHIKRGIYRDFPTVYTARNGVRHRTGFSVLDVAKLSPGEASLIKKLFRDKRSMSLRQANHERISKAIKAHKNSLKADYEKIFFVTNRAYIIPGVIISALTLAGYLLLGTEVSRGIDAIFLSIFAVVWMERCVATSRACRACLARRALGAKYGRRHRLDAFCTSVLVLRGLCRALAGGHGLHSTLSSCFRYSQPSTGHSTTG